MSNSIKIFLLLLMFAQLLPASTEEKILSLEKKINVLYEQISANKNEVLKTEDKIQLVESEIKILKKKFYQRLISQSLLKKYGWQYKFKDSSLESLFINLKIFKNINEADFIVIKELQLKYSELKLLKNNLMSQNANLENLFSNLKNEELKLKQEEELFLKNTEAANSFLRFKGSLALPTNSEIKYTFGNSSTQKKDFEFLVKGLVFHENDYSQKHDVYSFGPGKVIFSDEIPFWGRSLIIKHPGEYYTVYAGIQSASVSLNDIIETHQKIAVFTHGDFYFELRHNDIAIDPLKWIRK